MYIGSLAELSKVLISLSIVDVVAGWPPTQDILISFCTFFKIAQTFSANSYFLRNFAIGGHSLF